MSRFEDAIPTVLENEGGWVNNQKDSGGETYKGIARHFNPSWPGWEIIDRYKGGDFPHNLEADQALQGLVLTFYRTVFWKFDGVQSQPVATKLFDTYVNEEHEAIKLAQEVAGVTPDGAYGPHTEAAINAMDPVQFLTRYRIFLVQHYEDIVTNNPKDAEFLNGWLRRARQ